MSLRHATVLEILDTRSGLQTVRVRLDDAADSADSPDAAATLRACNYLTLGSRVAIGQRVLVNTTGLELQLGTGGVAFVVPDEAFTEDRRYGHIVKLRYTPLQRAVDSVEEQDAPSHALLQNAESIEGMPVVCCELHSQVPLVAAAIKHAAPEATVAYLMNDAAALPLAFSDVLHHCREAGLIDQTVSAGQAFGGQYEAINLYSALLTAHTVCAADVAIVAPGPGVVGSGTAFGHSGIAQGEALNAAAALGGTPLAVLRLSWQDARPRHHGLSHHTRTVLGRVCLCEARLPLPGNLSASQTREVMQQMEESGILARHALVPVFAELDAVDLRGVEVTTMGRGRDDDPAFFSAAFAAGILATSPQ
ncbi:MAG: DUF3866 family protein [Coriobacteriales bacterium]|jgi:hypothetical protein|nr:DUF3866 family protein [Coriobacteriales bacterium]